MTEEFTVHKIKTFQMLVRTQPIQQAIDFFKKVFRRIGKLSKIKVWSINKRNFFTKNFPDRFNPPPVVKTLGRVYGPHSSGS